MDTSEALTAIARPRKQGNDDAHAEAKSCGGGLSKDVWESVSAFANTGGGTLLLGIDERKGFAPAASFDLDRVRDQFVSGVGDGARSTRSSPTLPTTRWSAWTLTAPRCSRCPSSSSTHA